MSSDCSIYDSRLSSLKVQHHVGEYASSCGRIRGFAGSSCLSWSRSGKHREQIAMRFVSSTLV